MTFITLDSIAIGLELGKFTSVDLVKTYIVRINEVDNSYQSVFELNPDATSIAQQLDNERIANGRRGFVVPFLNLSEIRIVSKSFVRCSFVTERQHCYVGQDDTFIRFICSTWSCFSERNYSGAETP